jgi:primase-polymerase (primpol)-like protein
MNSATWRPWASAKAHIDDADIAGAGIMLGRLDDGRYLVGIDLDLVLSAAGEVQPWAQSVLDACQTYAEISPSGVGIKLFGYARTLAPCLVGMEASINTSTLVTAQVIRAPTRSQRGRASRP